MTQLVGIFDTLFKSQMTCYDLLVSQMTFEDFKAGVAAAEPCQGPAIWFICKEQEILVAREEAGIALPVVEDAGDLGFSPAVRHFLGTAGGRPCLAAEVAADSAAPGGYAFEGLRSLFGSISDGFFSIAARALEVLEWDRAHRFCGACATATVAKSDERARQCPACGSLSYPRISPAVIVAVVRGDRILLARAHRFPPGLYSVLAGFVEPGESLEECVAREVREETGIEVKGLRYFASQPWPFPHSLMIAFTAEYGGGEIRIDDSEVVDAGWYAADALPDIPAPITVARRLIDWFRAG
jgi:NAD+ diphosphatase